MERPSDRVLPGRRQALGFTECTLFEYAYQQEPERDENLEPFSVPSPVAQSELMEPAQVDVWRQLEVVVAREGEEAFDNFSGPKRVRFEGPKLSHSPFPALVPAPCVLRGLRSRAACLPAPSATTCSCRESKRDAGLMFQGLANIIAAFHGHCREAHEWDREFSPHAAALHEKMSLGAPPESLRMATKDLIGKLSAMRPSFDVHWLADPVEYLIEDGEWELELPERPPEWFDLGFGAFG